MRLHHHPRHRGRGSAARVGGRHRRGHQAEEGRRRGARQHPRTAEGALWPLGAPRDRGAGAAWRAGFHRGAGVSRVAAVIADDEPLLRAQLRSRLSRLWPELDVVREMENGRDVEAVIDEHSPDLFFLDIHMPGVNGLEAARLIGARAHVVFVTAFDQYAVEAFEQGAVDYVLKPFNEERLAITVDRLKARLGTR